MSTTGAAGDGLLRGMFEGCISGGDMGVSRRPYHKNCKCALHKSGGRCPHPSRNNSVVSYPIRRSWSEGCLALMASVGTTGATSPSASPAVTPGHGGDHQMTRTQTHLVLCKEEDAEGDRVSFFCKV